jgi:hypothetical protein
MTRFKFCCSSRIETDAFAMYDILYDKNPSVKPRGDVVAS